MSDAANRPPTTTPPANPPTPDDQGDDPDYAAWRADPVNGRFIARNNRESAAYRIRTRNAEQRLAALDPDGSGTITHQALRSEVRELKIGRALDAASRKHGVADSELLGAYLDRAGHLKDLDVDAPTFADDLDLLVEETVVNKPALRGGLRSDVAATTGARFTAPTTTTSRQLTKADLATMTPDQVDAARRAGDLDQLLGRR